MKYFAPELWLSWQESAAAQPSEDADPFKLYRTQLESLKPRVSESAFAFFAEADVHDGELLEFTVHDASRPAPLDEDARPWVRRLDYPVKVLLRVLDSSDRFVWTLEYQQVRGVTVSYPGQLFHHEGRGFGDWGYHELSDAGSGFLRHEVLFASGSSLATEFKSVVVTSLDARSRRTRG